MAESSVTLIYVALQAAVLAFVVLVLPPGRRWGSGLLLLVTMVCYHGFTEVLQLLFPGRNGYRDLVVEGGLAQWMPLISLALAVYGMVYLAGVFLLRRSNDVIANPWPNVLGWHIWLPVMVLLLGYRVSGTVDWDQDTFFKRIFSQFGYLILLITAIGVASRLKPHLRIITFLLLIVCGVLLSNRFTLLALLVATYYITRAKRCAPGWISCAIVGILALGFALTISVARFVVGRGDLEANFESRVSGVSQAVEASWSVVGESVLDDFVYRFDGNSFGATAVTGLGRGEQPAGLSPLRSDLNLLVPSVFSPSKKESDVYARDSEAFLAQHFDLDPKIDYTVTLLGFAYCMGAVPGLLMVASAIGVMFAFVDTRLAPQKGWFAQLILINFYCCAALYEQNFNIYFINGRSVLVLSLLGSILCLIGRLSSGERRIPTAVGERVNVL